MTLQDINMTHHWLPFTPNRSFHKDPRVFVAADGMHFTTHDGRQVLDGISSLWCVGAGHNRKPINEAIKSNSTPWTTPRRSRPATTRPSKRPR